MARSRSPQMDDLTLTRAAGDGDRDAMDLLARRIFNRVRATASYLCRNEHDADDLAQVAMVQILRQASSYRGDGRLEAWADRLTMREVYQWFRKKKRRRGLFELFTKEKTLDPPGRPRRQTDRWLIKRGLANALGDLPENRRAVLVLKYVHGYRVQEIADLLDVPLNTVRDRLRIGKKQLRRQLERDPALRAALGMDDE